MLTWVVVCRRRLLSECLVVGNDVDETLKSARYEVMTRMYNKNSIMHHKVNNRYNTSF